MIGLVSIIALGFFLGMRHATDPDHVIAVTTIVSRYKKIGHAAMIGAFWGLGHTLTILIVGSGIILFGWVIPARIGLSMEFSVGLMLILLGILNLTGMMQWITGTFSSAAGATGEIGSGHSHPHTHGDYIHTHPHKHEPEAHPHDSRKPHSVGSIAILGNSVSIKWCGRWSSGLSTDLPLGRGSVAGADHDSQPRNGRSSICSSSASARSRE